MMVGCHTAGLTVRVDTDSARWARSAREACAGQEVDTDDADVRVTIASDRRPFSLRGFNPLTRGAWTSGRDVVIQDACASGIDLRLSPGDGRLRVEARARPAPSTRVLGMLARARAELLWRDAVIQYPALWWAGVTGSVPVHVSALQLGDSGVVLAGPGGVGKSTLLRQATSARARAVSDNLCVANGSRLHGLLEPLRADGGPGRRMPHGRRERPWTDRLESVEVERVLVLRRGSGAEPVLTPMSEGEAARVIATGTYAAGELRRYWAFAATLALGTGLGPAHPEVVTTARRLVRDIPCLELLLPATPGTSAVDLLVEVGGQPLDRPVRRG